MRSMALRIGAVIAGLLVLVLPLLGGTPVARADKGDPPINGGGSSFAKLEIDQWRSEVARKPFELTVNYVSQGSTYGRTQYATGQLEFGASDIPFSQLELNGLSGPRANFVYVPVSAGGLGIMYNLVDLSGNRVTTLKLTRRAACMMFTVPNMRWNDPEIANANPEIRMPDHEVFPVVRADGSGTSYVFSQYCQAVAPDVWQAFITLKAGDASADDDFKQGRPTSFWPQNWGNVGSRQGADGVAAEVAADSGLYGVTYNEAGFAKVLGFPNASLANQQGIFMQPTEAAVSTALAYAQGRPDGTFILDFDAPDAGAYFPSTYSYVIAQTTGFDPAKGKVLARFLCYAVTKGQRQDLTEQLNYARLSAPLVELAKNAIAKIPGAPAWEQCKVDSAPPPTTPTTTATTVAATIAPTIAPTTPGGGTTAPTTPGGGTTAATTPSGGTTSGTTAGGGTIAGGSTGGVSTGGGSTGGGSSTGVTTGETVVSIDPDTGETIVVAVTLPQSETGCVDPVTGLPADASACTGDVAAGGVVDAGSTGAGGGAAPASTLAPINPEIDDGDTSPAGSQIVWWLVQGASVSAVGVALAGARRRFT